MTDINVVDKNERVTPFTREFVIQATINHMIQNVDRSIAKTTSRIAEFTGNVEKSTEILQTLSDLHQIKSSLLKGTK